MRRSSTEQLADFFGRKNGSMCQENISSSKPAILGMASRLGGFEALSRDPMLEMEVEIEMDPLDIKSLRQEMEEYIVLEEEIRKCMPWLALSLGLCLCRKRSSQQSGRPWFLCLQWGHCEFKNCSSQ